MCGIGGLIGQRSKEVAKKIIKKLSKRGPDSSSFWISDENEYPITICHTRLSILDLSDLGAQPFFSRDKRYVLSFNGEIYNYLELKEELKAKGCIFNTRTDTEVLLEGLICEGIDFQLKCNGMWAFCLWDRKLNKAILSRDRFGVKPLYYAFLNKDKLIFGSEMKSITPFLNSINPSKNINQFIHSTFNYEATEECVIEGVKRLKAGHYLTFENDKVSIKKYWNTLDHIQFNNDKYASQVEQWKYLFLDAVNLRMRSDVPLGSALSGGLDSSSVVSAMSYISKKTNFSNSNLDWQNAFCSSFPGSFNDEIIWAEKLAKDLSIPINKITLKQFQFQDSLMDSIAQVEDPYLTIPLPMINTYKEIKNRGVNVTLDGHGADELFCGYGHIKKLISSTTNIKKIRELIAIEQSTINGIYSIKQKRIKRKWVKYKLIELIEKYTYKGYLHLNKLNGSLFNSFKISPISF